MTEDHGKVREFYLGKSVGTLSSDLGWLSTAPECQAPEEKMASLAGVFVWVTYTPARQSKIRPPHIGECTWVWSNLGF